MPLPNGRRADMMAIDPKGCLTIVEIKVSRADLAGDAKWTDYLEFCDRFFWAVDADFPVELLPDDTGLIIADHYDAEIVRMGPELKLNAARRKGLTHRFARHAARRWHGARDPGLGLG